MSGFSCLHKRAFGIAHGIVGRLGGRHGMMQQPRPFLERDARCGLYERSKVDSFRYCPAVADPTQRLAGCKVPFLRNFAKGWVLRPSGHGSRRSAATFSLIVSTHSKPPTRRHGGAGLWWRIRGTLRVAFMVGVSSLPVGQGRCGAETPPARPHCPAPPGAVVSRFGAYQPPSHPALPRPSGGPFPRPPRRQRPATRHRRRARSDW